MAKSDETKTWKLHFGELDPDKVIAILVARGYFTVHRRDTYGHTILEKRLVNWKPVYMEVRSDHILVKTYFPGMTTNMKMLDYMFACGVEAEAVRAALVALALEELEND